MKKIYYIRHGRPDFGLDEKYCLGKTDMPLGPVGRMQSCILAEHFAENGIEFDNVFSSPLKRAAETAAFISDDYSTVPGTEEAYAGDWDGLCFTEIKKHWPELYEKRETDRSLPIPNAEDRAEAKQRFDAAMDLVLPLSGNSVAVVAHDMVIKLHLGLDIRIKIPYCAYCVDGEIHIPDVDMTPVLAEKLVAAAGANKKIQAHCRAVADRALGLAEGLDLDMNLIECSALLHDIAKGENKHELIGSRYLKLLGYNDIADIIRQHKEPDTVCLNEASVVFLADKLICGTDEVTLEERFDRSMQKCKTPEAEAAHERRLKAAREIERLINE